MLSAWLLGWALNQANIQVAWWIDAPSVLGFYGVYRSLFDNYLWSRIWPGGWRASSIPDIHGTWVGYVRSSHNANQFHPAVLYVHQSWTKISVTLETTGSRSSSTMASLNTAEAQESGLKYEFLNEPRAHEVATMNSHRGVSHLRLSSNGKELEGEYFTGRGRMNYGSLCLTFCSTEAVNREEALNKATEYISGLTKSS